MTGRVYGEHTFHLGSFVSVNAQVAGPGSTVWSDPPKREARPEKGKFMHREAKGAVLFGFSVRTRQGSKYYACITHEGDAEHEKDGRDG